MAKTETIQKECGSCGCIVTCDKITLGNIFVDNETGERYELRLFFRPGYAKPPIDVGKISGFSVQHGHFECSACAIASHMAADVASGTTEHLEAIGQLLRVICDTPVAQGIGQTMEDPFAGLN